MVVAAIVGLTRFIDWRIERMIREETFLHRIASSLRPTVIFDENGSVLVDQGAMELINSIDVSLSDARRPAEIVVVPNRYLAHPPLLQTLENELVDVVPTRGKHFLWRFKLNYEMYNETFTGKRRFRMEVVL